MHKKNLHPTVANFRLKKEEKIRRRKKEETHGVEQTIQVGHRDPPLGLMHRLWVSETHGCFFFFFFPSGGLGSPLGLASEPASPCRKDLALDQSHVSLSL
jgi:hypothetical protein